MFIGDSSSPLVNDCNFSGNTVDSGARNIEGSIDPASGGNNLLLNYNIGDVNFDLVVDSGDIGYVLASWSAGSVLNADLNDDGMVDGVDLAYILGWFGATCDPTTSP